MELTGNDRAAILHLWANGGVPSEQDIYRAGMAAMAERCAAACESERVEVAAASDRDYNTAIRHCASACRALAKP